MKRTVPVLLMCALLAACAGGAKKDESYTGYGAESVKPEILRQFAPAPLDPQVSRQIQAMLDVRSPGMGMVHPDGKRLYFSWRVTGTSQIWRLDRPEGFPVQMTGGEDSASLATITPDGKYLVIARDRNGDESYGLYVQPVDGGALEVVQHLRKVRTVFEHVSDNSEWIYFRANEPDPESYAIYRYSLKTKAKEPVFTRKGIWSIIDARPDGRLLLSRQITNTANEVFEFQPKTQELKPLFGQGESLEYQVVYGPREDEYFVITPRGEYRGIFHVFKGKEKALAPGLKGDVISVGIDHGRTHLAFVANVDAYMRLRVLNARDLSPVEIPLPATAEHTYSGWMSRDGRLMMVGMEEPQAPRSSFSYDFRSRKLTRWVVPSVPEVDLRKFVRAQLMEYPARDGTKIPMFVRRPPQCQNKACPVVVHFHGGPEGQSLPGFSVMAQMFVDQGFVFVEPNVRGSEGYGQTWLHSDNGARRLKVITDIEDCAKFIKQNWAVNGIVPKVGIMGWSYGGYSTLYGMTRFAGAYDAGVALVGMSNLVTFLRQTAPYRRALRVPEYGDPEKDLEALEELSPSRHLTKLKDPLLIIQGAEDPRVPAGEAIQFYNEMVRKGIPGGLILFADEGHGARKRQNQVLELGHTLAFFRKHLQ